MKIQSASGRKNIDSMQELHGAGTAQTTVSSANFNQSPKKFLTPQENEDRIGLLNKANHGGRPQARGQSAGANGYGRKPPTANTAPSAHFFYGANGEANANAQTSAKQIFSKSQ